MSDIIRLLHASGTESDQRRLERSLRRIARSVENTSSLTPPAYTPPPRPAFPTGIVPVWVVNPPINIIRRR